MIQRIALISLLTTILLSCQKPINNIPKDDPKHEEPKKEYVEIHSSVNQKTGWYQTNKLFFDNFFIDTDPAKVNNLYLYNGTIGFTYIPDVQNFFSSRQGSFYGDLNGDGKADLFNNYWAAPFGTNKAGYYVTWEHEKLGFSNANIQLGLTGARKFIFNDYYNNGKPSMLVASSGVDAIPFPGDSIQIIQFSPSLAMSSDIISNIMGYYHTGASADIDNDGDIDILMYSGGGQTKMGPVYLENKGGGKFQHKPDLIKGLGYEYNNPNNYYALELFDVNNDGFIDVILGGSSGGSNPNRILWGSSSFTFSTSNQTILPFESKYSSVMDFGFTDYDKDSDIDIVLLYEISYQGFGIQLLENSNGTFKDVTSLKIDISYVANSLWFGWIRIKDFDKDNDIDFVGDGFGYVKDQEFNKQTPPKIMWLNDGNGVFKASIKY